MDGKEEGALWDHNGRAEFQMVIECSSDKALDNYSEERMTYNTVDLFCGAGGFTEGFSKSGDYNPLLAVDFDKQAVDTFRFNHPKVNAICSDVSALRKKDVLSLTKWNKVHVVIGGPPCQ